MKVVCGECERPVGEHIFVSLTDLRCPTDTQRLTDEELEHIKWEANGGYKKMVRAQRERGYSVFLDRLER